jgi:hypothetical protein
MTYKVIFTGEMVRYENERGFFITKWSPFNKRAKLPREEHDFGNLAEIQAGLRDYGARMKTFALTGDLIGLASQEEEHALNGLKIFATMAKGQRKPPGFTKVRSDLEIGISDADKAAHAKPAEATT